MNRLRVFRGAGAFQRAEAIANLEGLRVSGTYVEQAPVYFLTHPDATDEEVEGTAFRIREGRDLSDNERVFKAAYLRHMQRQSA